MRFSSTVFLTRFFTIFFIVCSYSFADNIIKSPNDKRLYKSIVLENQIEVLLISDPQTDRAAAALDIKVGSGNDPKTRQGIAHFLEHMLFLGTEKYPKAGEYQEFIQRYGGSHNAYTSFSDTNYFFEIDADHLAPALDRFSQQFVSPLFNPEYVEREVNAVHSEYSAKLKDDFRRSYSAFRSTLNEENAYSAFSVGNLTTLKNDSDNSLHRDLLDFYHKNYSSNLMKVVIYGKDSLSQLETTARSSFSKIPNNHLTAITHDQPFFKEKTLPAILKIEPIMEARVLELSFPMPSTEKLYHEKPTYYLSNLIGHEGKGSLLSALKSAGLAESLSAGGNMDTGHESIFSIRLTLTPKGVQEWQTIAALTLSYINLIKADGMQPFYFDEQKKMLELAFEYQQKSQPIHYASSLAATLQEIPAKDALKAGYLLESYSPNLYQSYLDYLTADNMLITLTAGGLEYSSNTEWYDTPYSFAPLDPATLNDKAAPYRAQLFLPKKNDFIPDSAAIIQGKTLLNPLELISEPGLNAWFAFDNEFSDPKAAFYINIRSPKANNTAKNAVLTELLTRVVQDELNEFSYPATLAGLDFSIYNHIRGISVKISGYPDKQSILLSRILNTLKNGQIQTARLQQFKDELRRNLENASKQKPYEQTAGKIREFLIQPLWNDIEKLAEVNAVTKDELEAFRLDLFAELDIVTLAHGNTSYASALSLNNLVRTYLHKGATPAKVERGTVLMLNSGDQYLKLLSFDHPDTGYSFFIQGENKSYKERALFSLLSQMLSSPYYTDIRTEKQLGYIVFATPFSMLEVPGLAFIVQSPNSTYEQIHQHTSDFLRSYSNNINEITDSEFNDHKSALINLIQEKDKQLSERTARYWREIDEENFNFDTKEKLAQAIRDTAMPALEEKLRRLLDAKRNLLVVKQGDGLATTADSPEAEPVTLSNEFVEIESKDSLWEILTPKVQQTAAASPH